MRRVPYSAAMHRMDRVLNGLANGNIEAITGTDADLCTRQNEDGTLGVRFRSETQDIVIKVEAYERFIRKNKAARKLMHFIMSQLRPGECKTEFYLSELIDTGIISSDIRSARRLLKQSMMLLEQILIYYVDQPPDDKNEAKMIKAWSIKHNAVLVVFSAYAIDMLWKADVWLRDDTWWIKDDEFTLLLYIEYMRERSRRKKAGFAISMKAICKYMAVPSDGNKPADSCKRVIMGTIKSLEATKFVKLTFEEIREFDRWYKDGKIEIGEKVK